MMKHANFKVITAIVVVLILAAITTMPLLAAANYSYQFEPNSNYAQSDDKVILRIFPGTSADPTQVTWIDPQGAHVSCSGGQGVCWDQSVSANGDLIWRVFYLPIAGYQRPSGTYTAIVYNFSSELFRADFYISGATITPTPTPTPIPIGTLDPTFGSGGIVTTDVGDYCTTVAIQSDGKIVVAGTGIYVGDFALARFNTDGSLDTGFGADGKVTTDFGSHDTPRSVAVQEDGKIILAGSSAGDFAIARYNHNGSLDPGFGAAGKVTTDFGASETGNSVAVQDDNKIVAAGYSSLGSELGSNFVLARYNSDGSLDTGFGSGGKVTTSFGGRAYGSSVAVQDDGKIVVAGGSDKNFALARYNSDGSLDTGFGANGKVTTDFGRSSTGSAMFLQADGKIVVAGTSYDYSPDLGSYDEQDFALARFNTDGSLDTGFGAGGTVTTDLGADDYGNAVALQNDGKIVVAGYTMIVFGTYRFALAQYTSAGSLDTDSGTSGTVTTHSGEGYAVAAQDDGKVVVAGSDHKFKLIRYVIKSPTVQIYLPVITR